MATKTDICNRALQRVGAARLSDLDTDASPNARACRAAYDVSREALLQEHTWSFAIAREEIAEGDAPAWGRGHAYPLPGGFLRLAPRYPEDNPNTDDWLIEGQFIVTDDTSPIQVRYVQNIVDPNLMHPLFREALAMRIAHAICEEVTQSNTKQESVRADEVDAITVAKKINAIEQPAQEPPEDPWLSVRA